MIDLKNQDCTRCGLCKFRTHVVNGYGSLHAKIVLVGEGPGQDEDRLAEPFVGMAGKELNKMLEKAGIDRSSLYITNTVRCLPKAPPNPNNRATVRPPADEEISACASYLDLELFSLKPNVIVPMGNIALKAILGKKTAAITKYRGREIWSDKYQCKVMPVLHPAAILRQLQNEAITIEDFTRIKNSAETKELTQTKIGTYIKVQTLDQFDEFVEKIQKEPEFALDIETTGLNWQTDKIILISLTWKERTACIVPLIRYKPRIETCTEIKKKKIKRKIDGKTQTIEKEVPVTKEKVIDEYEDFWGDKQNYVLEKLGVILGNSAGKILQNGKFDLKFLIRDGLSVKNFTFDTLLSHHLLDENAVGRHGLKDLALSYTDLGPYGEVIDDWFRERRITDAKKNYAMLPDEMLYQYAGADTDCCFRLKKIFEAQLKKEGLWECFQRLIMPLSTTLMYGELEGVQIDTPYLKELKEELQRDQQKLYKELVQEAKTEINFNSTKQLRELFFNKMHYPVVKMTKGGKSGKQNPATDEEALTIWASQGKELPKLLLSYRKIGKLLSTYVEGIEERLDDQGRIHTEYLIHGTSTGRLSSRNPNLQNIPRDDKRIKKLFTAKPEHVLIEADYAQAEFRILAIYSQDEKLIADIIAATNGTGPDVHKLMASEVLGIPVEQVTKEQRNKAKGVVFGVMYGRGAKSVAEEYGFTEEEAQTIINHFFGKYPKAEAWLNSAVATVQAYGQIRNLFGRLRRLPTIKSPDMWLRADAERQAKNSPIQSAASDMTCNAANRLRFKAEAREFNGRFCLQVHDSLTYEVPINGLEQSLNTIKEEMEKPVRNSNVPMVAEFKIGKKLGTAAEWVKKDDSWYQVSIVEGKKMLKKVDFNKLALV